MGGGDFSTLLSGFHNKTHTPKFFIRPTKKFLEEREEKRPRPKKGSGVLFLGRRGKPLVKKKEKRNGETKKKCMSLSRVSPKKKKRTSNNKHTLKKNRVKVARAPSSSSIRITRGNRRGFVLNEEEGEGEEERDGRESFWWGRGRSRANRK